MTRRMLSRRNKEYSEELETPPSKPYLPRSSPQRGQSSSNKYRGSHDVQVAALLYPTNNDSSFASNSSSNSKFSPVRFNPDTSLEYEKELSPEEGALQFVPALEAEQMLRQHPGSNAAAAAASWDALLVDEEKKDSDTPIPPSRRTFDSATAVSAAHRKGGRIARLASLFSSRATVRGDGENASSPVPQHQHRSPAFKINNNQNIHVRRQVAPPSPAQSSGSSAYVGWPGTQDKRGNTVKQESSYDDSSVGGTPLDRRNGPNYEKELQDAALQEMNRWTNQQSGGSFDDFSSVESFSGANSPARRINRRRRITSPNRAAVEEDRNEHSNYNPHDADESSVGAGSEDPADYHLAAAVADAARRSNMVSYRNAQSDIGQGFRHTRTSPAQPSVVSTSRSTHSVRFKDAFPHHRSDGNTQSIWDDSSSPEGSTLSKTSSAYLNASAFKSLNYPVLGRQDNSSPNEFGRYGDASSAAGAAAAQILRKGRLQPQPPTEDALKANERLAPPHRTFPNAEGYRGLLDKTKDVPCLMDAMDSDSMSSSKATSVVSGNGPQPHKQQDHRNNESQKHTYPGILRNKARVAPVDVDAESDVFDGINESKSDVFDNISSGGSPRRSVVSRSNRSHNYPARIAEEDDNVNSDDNIQTQDTSGDFKLVMLRGGLTAIQTTDFDYSQRRTASDYDDQLSNSEVSSNGYTRIPGFHEMVTAGMDRDSSLAGISGNIGQPGRPTNTYGAARSLVLEDITYISDGEESAGSASYYDDDRYGHDLSHYYVQPSEMKKLVRRYRELSELYDVDMSLEEFEKEEDGHKAFALFEMRSRIMESDIERGLERRGGTVPLDDIILTSHNRAALRVRDAVIVSKAWRDGATISDVVKADLLTRRGERTFFIRRRIRGGSPNSSMVDENASSVSGFTSSFYWEPVKWIDDTDFMQYRCPSLGARHMRGFEMFTVGDCQSILLKLTNERCMELRSELNDATRRQIEAEEMLRDEGNHYDDEMTEAEMEYLTAMEDVKMISKKLVSAEQAFTLVRDRIQKLIEKYESILVKLDSESFAGASSIVSYESSYFSDHDSAYWDAVERKEKEMWAKRARRAEIRAEIAAREAMLAKQEARMIHEQKGRELDELRQQLFELQSETSTATVDRDHSVMLAKSLVMRRHDNVRPAQDTARTVRDSKSRINSEKIEDVKQRFRDRIANKKHQTDSKICTSQEMRAQGHHASRVVTPNVQSARDIMRAAGEEMFQQMDFYERSLKAVNQIRS